MATAGTPDRDPLDYAALRREGMRKQAALLQNKRLNFRKIHSCRKSRWPESVIDLHDRKKRGSNG